MDVKAYKGEGKLQHVIEIGPHKLLTDAPKVYGGEETGPEPHDFLAAALAACTALTVKMYARRKDINLQDVRVTIHHERQGDTYVFVRNMQLIGRLTDEEKSRLTEIADRCPVHKTLSGPIKIIAGETT